MMNQNKHKSAQSQGCPVYKSKQIGVPELVGIGKQTDDRDRQGDDPYNQGPVSYASGIGKLE